eukprot:2119665-Prymnesium_polylepis.2
MNLRGCNSLQHRDAVRLANVSPRLPARPNASRCIQRLANRYACSALVVAREKARPCESERSLTDGPTFWPQRCLQATDSASTARTSS